MKAVLASCFNGMYNFRRIVKNENIFMSGTATFNDLGNGKYHYHEIGHYMLHDTTKNCFQTRFFIIEDTSLIVQKIDGSVLHEFQIPQDFSLPLVFRHTHHCKNDMYDITLTVLSKNEFMTDYKINGPQKNEEIRTYYTR